MNSEKSIVTLNSQFNNLNNVGVPKDFCLQVQGICDRMSDPVLTDRWLTLIRKKKFDLSLAKSSLKVTRKYVSKLNPSSIDQILDYKEILPSIGTIRHYRGDDAVEAFISEIISLIEKSLNLVRPITSEQIVICVRIVVSKYHFLTLADLKLIVNNGLTGMYGRVFDRFDVGVFFEWVNKYVEDRLVVSESRHMREHDKVKHVEQKLSNLDEDRGKIERVKELINLKNM